MSPHRILLWHVHGAWTTSLVQGPHEYLLPVVPGGGPWGRGRCGRDWPARAREVPSDRLAATDVDLVVLQRPRELELATRWLRRRPGVDVPAVYVEHNTPREHVPDTRHPVADRDDITLVHVTPFNDLMWDSGRAPTTVIEHGIVDPGYRYAGDLDRGAVVINEPLRRWRVTGTDLLPRFADVAGLDVFGMGLDGLADRLGLSHEQLRAVGDLPTVKLHDELARRRFYLHPVRWTSLGLSLVEAMHLGMPVIGLATTEACRAVPPDAGVVATDVAALVAAARDLVHDRDRAVRLGRRARQFALARYGLAGFLDRWNGLIDQVTSDGGGA